MPVIYPEGGMPGLTLRQKEQRQLMLPIVCYDFHHHKGAKEEEISKMIQRKTKLDDELKEELDKCAVVCANCHRQINVGLIKIQ